MWRWQRTPTPEQMFNRAGASCGKRPRIKGELRVRGPVSVGDDLLVDGPDFAVILAALQDAKLMVGHGAYLNRGTDISAWQNVVIGDNLRMGEFASIQDWDGHPLEEGADPRVAPVTIGDNVWIGRRAMVLPGVKVGDHAVIAAGAVVVGDVADRTLVGGVPARPLREDLRASDGWRRP